ncbi:MAG: GNAT family N-acetyltransferase [Burkholderiaceae bacterium]
MTNVVIRRMKESDEQGWLTLWRGYNAFYERAVEDRTTARVWGDLHGQSGQPYGFVADKKGMLVGFSHYYFLRSTSDWGPRCYMQDLFCALSVRGEGVGHALIEAVYAEADKHGASQTYWLTTSSNKTARKLYDRVAQQTPFVKYKR